MYKYILIYSVYFPDKLYNKIEKCDHIFDIQSSIYGYILANDDCYYLNKLADVDF